MNIMGLREVLDGIVEEYGDEHTLFVATNPESDLDPEAFPAELVFTVREAEDHNGDMVVAVYVSVYALSND